MKHVARIRINAEESCLWRKRGRLIPTRNTLWTVKVTSSSSAFEKKSRRKWINVIGEIEYLMRKGSGETGEECNIKITVGRTSLEGVGRRWRWSHSALMLCGGKKVREFLPADLFVVCEGVSQGISWREVRDEKDLTRVVKV